MNRVRVPELVTLRAVIAAVALVWPVTACAAGAVTLTEIPAARVALTLTAAALLFAAAVWVTRPPYIVVVQARGGRHRRGNR